MYQNLFLLLVLLLTCYIHAYHIAQVFHITFITRYKNISSLIETLKVKYDGVFLHKVYCVLYKILDEEVLKDSSHVFNI